MACSVEKAVNVCRSFLGQFVSPGQCRRLSEFIGNFFG